jgi:hypothetical protein
MEKGMTEDKTWNVLLKDYINKNYSTLIEFRKDLEKKKGVKLPQSTLSDYLRGRVKCIERKDYVDALYEFTQIEAIKDAHSTRSQFTIKNNAKSKRTGLESKIDYVLGNIKELNEIALMLTGEEAELSIEDRIEIFARLVNSAVNQASKITDYYSENKSEIPTLIEGLNKRLNMEDVGYLMQVFNAMFYNDRFKSWVLGSRYTPKRKK